MDQYRSVPQEPPELVLYSELKRMNTLPEAGGYFDQPWTLTQDLRAVETAIRHRQNSEALQNDVSQQTSELAAKARAMAGI